MMDPDKLPVSLKPSLEEALSGSRPDVNNNEKDHMKEDLEDVKKDVTEIKNMLYFLLGLLGALAVRLFGFL